MKELHRSMTIYCLLLGALLLASTSRAQTRPPIVEQLAKTYGLDSYGQVEAIRYTFNLQLPALKLDLSRSWEWEPKTGKVSKEKTRTASRSRLPISALSSTPRPPT